MNYDIICFAKHQKGEQASKYRTFRLPATLPHHPATEEQVAKHIANCEHGHELVVRGR